MFAWFLGHPIQFPSFSFFFLIFQISIFFLFLESNYFFIFFYFKGHLPLNFFHLSRLQLPRKIFECYFLGIGIVDVFFSEDPKRSRSFRL
mmetsp:Transcript_38121/g.52974  ORF Transcript_38121/g.52974 Transcript_38121/m.52974 type:complete len:90 (-) Transcript_38121:184-453(-)